MVTKGFHKKKSKRIPARLRYKVEKKVKDHRRKIKKEAKKKQINFIKKKKTKCIIPNNVPFKDKIIKEFTEIKEKENTRRKLLKIMLKDESNIHLIMKPDNFRAKKNVNIKKYKSQIKNVCENIQLDNENEMICN